MQTPVVLFLLSRALQVWDVIPGDIRIIKRATCLSERYRTITYKDSYCTVRNSNTWKIIREYQAHGDNREDTMELEVSERYPVPWAKFSCPVF